MAFVTGFIVVHVGAVAVHLFADGMPGTMDEVVAVAGLLNDVAGRLINLPAADGLACMHGVLDKGNGGIPGMLYDTKNIAVRVGDGLADIAGPGDVGIDAAR